MPGQIANLLIPYKTINYLEQYYDVIESVAEFRAGTSNSECEAKYRRTKLTVQLICGLYIFKVTQMLYWMFVPNDPMEAAILVDLFQMANLNRTTQILSVLLLLFAHNYYLLYLDYCPIVLRYGRSIMVQGNGSGFFLPPYTYKRNHLATTWIRWTTLTVINLAQVGVILMDIFAVYLHFSGFEYILTNGNYLDEVHLFAWLPLGKWRAKRIVLTCLACVIFELSCLLVVLAIYLTIHICILLFTVTLGFVLSGFILLWQLKQVMQQIQLYRCWFNKRLRRYLGMKREAVVLTLRANHFFGTVFFFFLLVNVPTNVYIVNEILFGHTQSRVMGFFVKIVCAQQWFSVFGMHWLVAFYNRKFREPSKQLIHVAVTRDRWLCLRTRLTLNLDVQTFHNRKPYGATYGKFGLITLKSFAEVSSKQKLTNQT